MWRPASESYAIECCSEILLDDSTDVMLLSDRLRSAQMHCTDTRTCTQRRRERMPTELHDLYRLAAITRDRAEASMYRKRAWRLRGEWMQRLRVESQIRAVQQGRVLSRAKKLFRIKHLYTSQDTLVASDEWARTCEHYYSTKYGTHNSQLKQNIRDFVQRAENLPPQLLVDHVANGFGRLRSKGKIGCDGLSIRSLEFLFLSQPNAFSSWLANLMASSKQMSSLSVRSLCLGKESANTRIDNTRVIIPLPSFLALLDAILPSLVEPIIDSCFSIPSGVWIGARARTQPLDISHGLSTIIEKSLDLESNGAVGQSDIRQYYDSINLLRVFSFLVKRGLDYAIAAACLRHQLFCSLTIIIGEDVAQMATRTRGSLTGSRVAGISARVPVLHLCSERAEAWKSDGFRTPRGILTMSTFVDNLFVAGKSCAAVTRILDDAEQFLQSHWELHIKPSSRKVLAPANCNDTSTTDSVKWPICMEMKVLGSRIQSDGGIDTCFDEALGKAWRAFFANCAGANVDRFALSYKMTLIQRSVVPVLRFKWSRWPFTISRARQLDAMQRRMYSIVMRLRPEAGQTAQSFVRWRGRKAADLQRRQGAWSKSWAHAVLSWASHLERDRNSTTWAAMVSSIRSPQELAERRAAFGSPFTRSAPGFICRRWFESLSVADEWSKT